jgi:hypothetical protein
MNDRLRFVPPNVEFDPRLTNEIVQCELRLPASSELAPPVIERRGPFNGYVRMLTPEAGVLILYQDQNRGLLIKVQRVLACILISWLGLWLIFFASSLSILQDFLAVALLILIIWRIIQFKIKVSHSVEIRPDCMIIDGTDVFWAEDIGTNFPELQIDDNDPDCMTISGIVGTRWVDLMTVNRLDEQDRTAEILAADLREAMDQLWARQEVTFAKPG